MEQILLNKKHLTFTSCKNVDKLIHPIKNFGFTAFDYVRVYRNTLERIHLGNRLEWLEFFYQHLYSNENLLFEQIWLNNPEYWISPINMWGIYPNKKISNLIIEKLNISQGITLAFTNTKYNEYFYLGMENDNDKTLMLCLNNINDLLKFCFLFKDAANKLIKSFEKHKITAPSSANPVKKRIIPTETIGGFVKRYYVNNVYITQREKEIMHWIATGKTYDEIAMILNISNRTVDAHINHIKEKLDCTKITQLVYKLAKYGII